MGDIINFKKINHTNVQKRGGVMEDITKKRKQEIEKTVQKILFKEELLKDGPSLDVVRFVKKAGFKVLIEDMDIDTTGLLLVNDDDKTKIIVVNEKFKNPNNESDIVVKKSRFITAHEYGHYILHKKEGEPIYAHRDTYHSTEEKELEADYFARSLLMPIKTFDLFYQTANEIGNNDENFTVEILSRAFGVTKSKVKKRIGDLALLNS